MSSVLFRGRRYYLRAVADTKGQARAMAAKIRKQERNRAMIAPIVRNRKTDWLVYQGPSIRK